MKLLLVGATGLVGSHVLRVALMDQRIDMLIAPVRRALPEQPRLLAPIVDFDSLPADPAWWQADAVVCALGTTMRTAGSKQAFRRVDYGYPLAVAKLAKRHGTPTFVLNSAIGANPTSRFFYNRVKGEVEQELAGMGFRSLTFVRPGLIGGKRDEFRPAERVASAALRLIGPALPRTWRINPAERIAAAMIEAAVAGRPGTHIIASGDLI
jgi:uncharacterized protein YbjT (DUF2867 family)